MTRHVLLALLLTAAPAMAQDLGGQYSAAARAFTLPGTPGYDMEGLQGDDAVMALLPTLVGTWADALGLFPGPDAFDPDLHAMACERTRIEIVQTAPRSFVLRRTGGSEAEPRTLTIRHDWIIGNSFDRSVDENEAIARFGLDAMPELPMGILQFPGLRGEVSMFHPSPDILVFSMPGGVPEIYARCP
jgi:hypothetical protein